jgi:hypothetical protein
MFGGWATDHVHREALIREWGRVEGRRHGIVAAVSITAKQVLNVAHGLLDVVQLCRRNNGWEVITANKF